MLILDATTKSLQVVLASAVTSSQATLYASWADHKPTARTFIPGSSNGVTSGTTAATWVPAPDADVKRQIKYLSLFNGDSVSITATVMLDVSGTDVPLQRVTLLPGDRLEYTGEHGFRVVNAGGEERVGAVSPQFNSSLKNRIYNGSFDIWQRGTSSAASSTSRFLADRFLLSLVGSSIAASRQAFTPGQTDVPNNPNFYHRAVVTSAAGAGNLAQLVHTVENVRTLQGMTATLSFWAKADASKPMSVELLQRFGSGGSATVTGIGTTKLDLTSSWQQFVVPIEVPSITGQTVGDGSALVLVLWFDAGSNFNSRTDSLGQQSGTFDVAMIQLEEGPVATAFDVRPFGVELALCQRYYEKSYDIGVAPGTVSTVGTEANFMAGLASAAYRASFQTRFKTNKRSAPSITLYSPNTGASGMTRDAVNNVDKATTAFNIGETGFLAIWATGQTAATSYSIVGHWEADAEL